MTDLGQMLDPTGRIIVELRSDPEILALVGTVPGDATKVQVFGGEAHKDAAGAYVVVRRLGPMRRYRRAPVGRFRIVIDAYGRTWQEASKLSGLISDVLATQGPRTSPAGMALYLSVEEVGPQAQLDPDTDEPVERTIYSYSAALAQAGT
jgi:hypothetical protein